MTTPRCRPRRTSLPQLHLLHPRQEPTPSAARPSSPSQPDGEPPLQATAAGQSHTLQLDFATCTDHPRSRTHHKSRNSGTSTPKNPLRSTGGPRVTGFRDLAAASSGSGGGPSGGGGGGGGFGGFGRLGGGGGGDDSDDDGDEGKDPSSFYTGGAKRYVLAPPPPPLFSRAPVQMGLISSRLFPSYAVDCRSRTRTMPVAAEEEEGEEACPTCSKTSFSKRASKPFPFHLSLPPSHPPSLSRDIRGGSLALVCTDARETLCQGIESPRRGRGCPCSSREQRIVVVVLHRIRCVLLSRLVLSCPDNLLSSH